MAYLNGKQILFSPLGYVAGYEAGKAAGRKAEQEEFWDVYQNNGNRTSYTDAFKEMGWTNETFKPKYDFILTAATRMFYGSRIKGDLKKLLEERGLRLDMSGCKSGEGMYQFSLFSSVPEVDLRGAEKAQSTVFYQATNLETIENIRYGSNEVFRSWFTNCYNLKNVNFQDEICNSGLNLSSCSKLTKASILSAINALKDYSGTTDTRALTLGTTNLAKLTDAEKAIATQKGWTLA